METSAAARAAATSSWVDRGLQPLHEISAPAAMRVSMSTAVSLVTCRQPVMRVPLRLWAAACSLRSAIITGMRLSAQSIFMRPCSASAMSATL